MSCSTSQKKYDVFISFRGEDTRETFTSHLHYVLCKQNIITYLDDNNLIKGDEIGPALSQAIQDSRISLIIFSKNYATSKWCLNELLKILECRKFHGQVVIPVFYNIDPSDLRKQTGNYGEAFAKYEREVMNNNESFANTVSQWRIALAEVANIPGWDSQSRTHKDDSQVIQSIVNDVWQKLALMYPNQLKGLVHNDEQSEYAESLLKSYPRIGIWGMGGIGKTTIARQMFAKHFAQYDSACFLENVSKEVEKFGKTYIRNKLFSTLLKKEITESDILGATFIKRMLSDMKVFVVLDDVGNAAQLEYLCEELDDLGPNSRLIITARDRHTLRGRVDVIYEVKKWMFEESLRLFSIGAFKQNHPKDGYNHLSQRAVAYAGGVPLALKVLGSHFYSRSPEFWEPELKYLENKGESLRGIQEVLKVSYNGLTVREKEMFLDIAFFLKDENSDLVTSILDACGFNATSGIDMLEDKALITISYRSKIQMHNLLQKMAFDIVRQKKNRASRDPGKRSRLRDIEEVCDVFKNNKGTHKIEGIMFDLSQKGDLHIRADTFNKMTKLKFLRLYVPLRKKRLATVYSPEDMLPFSGKLIYLEWNGCPLKSLPHPFCVELLVEIHLPHSNVEYLWHGIQELLNLELINLSESKQLMELPDLSGTTKLKKLYLSGCESLREVHPSVFSKDTLVILLVDRCKNLESLVSEKHLTSLQVISISGCSSLGEFSLSGDSIKELNLSNIDIELLHASISHLSNHDLLVLRHKNLPKAMSSLRSITKLELSNCNMITKSMLEAIFDGLESSERLYLKDSKHWWQWCSSPECPEEEFRRFFHMNKATFEFICNELDSAVMEKNTMLRDAIPVRLRVAVCIWRLATGDALRIISKQFGLGISTCHKLVLEICSAIKKVLMPKFVSWPDENKMNLIKQEFEDVSGIPNVGGSIYTTHIPIIAPKFNMNAYFNSRHTQRNRNTSYSITIQGVVDTKGIFTDVCIGWPGSYPDDQVFEKSLMYQRVTGGNLNDVWVVGNSGFPLMDGVLVPYTHQDLTWTQHAFNEKVGDIQKLCKDAFAKVKGRWSCLQKGTEVKLQDLPGVLGACCVLHNICEMRNEKMDPEWNFELFDDEMVAENGVRSVAAVQARDNIAIDLLHRGRADDTSTIQPKKKRCCANV